MPDSFWWLLPTHEIVSNYFNLYSFVGSRWGQVRWSWLLGVSFILWTGFARHCNFAIAFDVIFVFMRWFWSLPNWAIRIEIFLIWLHGKKNGFVTATKSGIKNEFFVASTKNFAAATKRFVDRTKHFVVVTKYFCYPYFNKWLCWYNKTFFSVCLYLLKSERWTGEFGGIVPLATLLLKSCLGKSTGCKWKLIFSISASWNGVFGAYHYSKEFSSA